MAHHYNPHRHPPGHHGKKKDKALSLAPLMGEDSDATQPELGMPMAMPTPGHRSTTINDPSTDDQIG